MLDINAALFGTIRRMHAVQRYSSLPVLRPENVAEHSWQVAMLSYMIGLDVREREHGWTVNMELLLSKAICHDLSEVLSGDIIRSFKHSSPEVSSAINRADEINMRKLLIELSGDPAWQNSRWSDVWIAWANAKGTSRESGIVALADMLCVVSYCQEEHALGNRKLDHILKAVYEGALAPMRRDMLWTRPYIDGVFPNALWHDPYAPENLNIRVDQPPTA